jgi:hypothetical protein
MAWKAKKGYHSSDAKIKPMGGMSTGRNPDATFVPEGVSSHAKKKHDDFHKVSSHKPMKMRKPMIPGEY